MRTSSRSVAGRGLFYTAEECAKTGEMLSFIPSQCVLTKENAERQWPDLKLKLKALENDSTFDNDDWPVVLTAYAQRALHDNAAWSQWIQTWKGPSAPCPPESLTIQELQTLAVQSDSSPSEIERALQFRYNVFQHDCSRLATLGSANVLYGIVLSRAANLGPHWNYESGIIPLHDMLNHPPAGTTPSVELFTIGEIVSQTSHANVEQLMSSASFQSQQVQDQDLVLVAKRTIYPGEELFLSYTKRDLLSDEQERVWKMLQYGFCLS